VVPRPLDSVDMEVPHHLDSPDAGIEAGTHVQGPTPRWEAL